MTMRFEILNIALNLAGSDWRDDIALKARGWEQLESLSVENKTHSASGLGGPPRRRDEEMFTPRELICASGRSAAVAAGIPRKPENA